MYQIDKELRRALEMVLVKGLKLVFVIAVILYVTPSFAVIAGIMAVVYFYVQVRYTETDRLIDRYVGR